MRLTLRTLLAFLDNTLEPADAQALKPKVEESEFAKLITARIDSSLKQPRLSAPPLDGKGVGLDANEISQYLDNTLPAEKVPELEQFLLQSDMQLAEVAACHQILSAALETELTIPGELRHRIRCLGSPRELAKGSYADAEVSGWLKDSDSSVLGSPTVGGTPASVAVSAESSLVNHPNTITHAGLQPSSDKSKSNQYEIFANDPLRSSAVDWPANLSSTDQEPILSSRLVRIVFGLLLLGVLLLASFQAMGPVKRLSDLWRGKVALSADGEESSPPLSTSVEAQPNAAKRSRNNSDQSTTNDGDNPLTASDSERSSLQQAENREEKNSIPDSDNGSTTADTERDNQSKMIEKNDEATPAEPNKPTSDSTNSASGTLKTATSQNQAATRFAARWQPSEDLQSSPLMFDVNPERNQIFRLWEAIDLPSDTRVIVPPAARPSVTLKGSINWTSYGAMNYLLQNATSDSLSTSIELVQGKGVLQDMAAAESLPPTTISTTLPSLAVPKVYLRNGADGVLLRWLQPSSVVSVEATPMFVDPIVEPGVVANKLRAITELRIVVLQGSVEFRLESPNALKTNATTGDSTTADTGAEQVDSAAPKVLLSVGQGWLRDAAGNWQSIQIDATPAWLDASSERPIDRQALGDMTALIPGGERANVVARELLSNRRPEIAALAAQTLLLADDFSFLAGPNGFLNSDRFRSHWFPIVEAVRQRAASSGESFNALQASLISQDVQRGNLLFQTLIGSPSAEISSGEGEKLVNLLESEFLDERVLAIYQLKRMVGKDLGYQPDRPAKGTIQDWKRLLRSGGLRP